jgi:phosphoribosylamine--glycine ligase
MIVLVLGSGAREHALAWRLSRDGHRVFAAPGNPGIARVATCLPCDPLDAAAVVDLARGLAADLVVVGAEAPLVAGVVDALAAAGLAAFGPTRAAARLEGSKSFAKEFMARHGIATAPFAVCDDRAAVERALATFGAPVVVKADGLVAGKGVLVAPALDEARAFAQACLSGARFGDAGRRVVIEQFLPGIERSVFFLADGRGVAPFLPARDYKRLGDGDRGPNTGGMGAYAPADLDPALLRQVEATIARPTIEGLAAEGAPFRGLLYVGLMIDGAAVRVLEFNARFGDPETQALMPLVAGDLGAHFLAAARGALAGPLDFVPGATVGVVLAAAGYPDAPRGGDRIAGLATWPAPEVEDAECLWCFHAGTRRDGDEFVAAGGRVLTVVAHAADREAARERAYAGLGRLALAGAQWRRDVASPEPAWT